MRAGREGAGVCSRRQTPAPSRLHWGAETLQRTFIAGLAGFAVASAVGGAAPGFSLLVAARAVHGAFAALLAPSALALLNTTFTDTRERSKALGIYTAIAGGGGAIGLLLGGVLTQYLSWRWCLYANVVFAVVALAGAAVLVTNQQRSRSAALDVPGSLLAVGGLVAIVYGFSEASTNGWGSGLTISLIAGGVVLLAAFVIVERRAGQPLVPPAIIGDRIRATAYLGAALVSSACFYWSPTISRVCSGSPPCRPGWRFSRSSPGSPSPPTS